MIKPLSEDDCRQISNDIESRADAEAYRIYKQAEGVLVWTHGDCRVSLEASQVGATDVFKPSLVARDIMRVVGFCSETGLGGLTYVGQRRKFEVLVVNPSRVGSQ